MPVVTSLYAGLLGLLLIALTANVIRLRQSTHIGLNHGGNEVLEKAVRAHANFTEYLPLALLLMALNEFNGLAGIWLHVSGALLIAARLLHWQGLSRSSGVSFGRFTGATATFLVIIAHALLAIWTFVSATG